MKRPPDIKKLVETMLNGDVRALSRLMTLVESSPEDVPAIMSGVYNKRKPARRIGLSGPPGAGKSTLLSNIIRKANDRCQKVGVLCIDPTSPISGGAILGDRVRISDIFPAEEVFIRSVASGDSLGGLAGATKLQTLLLEAAKYDVILIETVGLGQVGYDITDIAETLILVLVPESGDTIQILKSGIIELADIVVVNKADRDGADEIAETLRFAFIEPRSGWHIPVVTAVAREGIGTDRIMEHLDEHLEYLRENGGLSLIRDSRTDFSEALFFQLKGALKGETLASHPALRKYYESVGEGTTDPYTAARQAVKCLLGG